MSSKLLRKLRENSAYNRKFSSTGKKGKRRPIRETSLSPEILAQNPANRCLARGSHKKRQKRVSKSTRLFWESLQTNDGWVPKTDMTREIKPWHWEDIGLNVGSIGSDDIPDREVCITGHFKNNPGKGKYPLGDQLSFGDRCQMSADFNAKYGNGEN